MKYNLSLLFSIIYQFERFRDKYKQNSTEIHTALGRVEIIDRAGICFVYICNNVKEC